MEKKLKRHIVHFVAHCSDCSWSTEDFLNGQRAARNHADRYRHNVSGEEGISVEYIGKESIREK